MTIAANRSSNGVKGTLCALLLAAAFGGGCGGGTMRMEGDMKMEGDVTGAMRFDGPIEIQIRGPSIKYEGVYVSEKILGRVEVGKTQTDWLVAVLGDPTSRAALEDGSEIWKWSYRPMEQEASIVQFFGGSKDEPALQPVTSFVHVRNGIAIDKWTD